MRNKTNPTIRVLLGVIALFCFVAPGWLSAKSAEDKVKEAIDRVSDALKKGVDECGNDLRAVQNYLDNYQWKGVIEDSASAGPATLSQVTLNGRPKAIAVQRGERIHGHLHCFLDPEKAETMTYYRVLIGFSGKGGQTTLYNRFGMGAGGSDEDFSLIAPQEPGLYEIRFRVVEKFTEGEAIKQWVDLNGNEPDARTTIGFVVVK